MKVILLQDVKGKGHKFDIVVVPDGYALNKLIPHGMAKPATKENLKSVESLKRAQSSREAMSDASFVALLETLKDTEVEVSVSTNEKGTLFEGFDEKHIVKLLEEKGFGLVDVACVDIEAPIKEVGTHPITLKKGDHKGAFSLVISSQ